MNNNEIRNHTFNSDYEFRECWKSGKRIFIGCNINNVNFANVFDNRTTNDEISFKNCRFNNTNFEGVTFNEKVVFECCNFKNTKFENVEFKKAELQEAEFLDTDFVKVKFDKANFSGSTFSGVDFERVEFGQANFNGAHIEFSNFFDLTTFKSVDFRHATLTNIYFNNVMFESAKFVGTTLKHVNFSADFGKENSRNNSRDNIDFIETTFKDVTFNAHFKSGVKFGGAKFNGEINFSGSEFKEKVSFIGAKFDGKINFTNTTFLKKAYFSDAEFSGDANFSGAEFNEANFSGAIFNYANFNNVKINKADFRNTEFKSVYFKNAVFSNDTDFTQAKFFNSANFNGSEFRKVYFTQATFNNAEFNGVKFNSVSFQNAVFENAKFQESNFEDANFYNAIINSAKFNNSKFNYANFVEATLKTADFKLAKFGFADFYRTTFEETTFEGATFQNKAYFSDIATKYADFSKATFEDVAVFKKRSEKIHSSNNPFLIEERWIDFRQELEDEVINSNPIMIFHAATFKNPKNVTFIDFSLSNISFLLTNTSNILIIGETDEILSEKLLKANNSQNKTLNNYVEKAIEALSPHLRKETVLAEYRNLRKSFENNRTYQEASNLFTREMKLLEEYLNWNSNPLEKIAHKIYNLFSYGESIDKPMIVVLLVLFLFPLFLCWLNKDWNQYLIHFENTARAFFQLSAKELGGWEILVKIFGAITLGLLFIAFRRRFERK